MMRDGEHMLDENIMAVFRGMIVQQLLNEWARTILHEKRKPPCIIMQRGVLIYLTHCTTHPIMTTFIYSK